MEQSPTGQPGYHPANHDNLDHQVFRCPHDSIRKSWLINISMNFINTTHMWVCDTDFYMDFAKLDLEQVLKHDYTQPYHYAKDLDDDQTRELVSTGDIDVKYYSGEEKNYRHINTFGALSFIVNIFQFQQIGSMCEEYEGWGYEDFDLYLRVHHDSPGKRIHIVQDILGLHMWHPEPETKPLTDQKNVQIFNNKGYTIDQINEITLKYYYTDWSLAEK